MYEYTALVTEVTDGDTVKLRVDCGFYIDHRISLRLLDVYAPETRTTDIEEKARGYESKKFLSDLILNREIIVHTKFDKTFDRYLGTIFLDGVNINQYIVEQGYATSEPN
jgi:micrococcal nuclease